MKKAPNTWISQAKTKPKQKWQNTHYFKETLMILSRSLDSATLF